MDNTKHWLEYLTAISALIAATAAIFAAIFSGLQASVANDTERRQLRAYVNIGSKDELSNFVENGKAHVQGVAENVGQTPVYDATWVSGINVLPTSGQRFSYSSCEQIMRSADAKSLSQKSLRKE